MKLWGVFTTNGGHVRPNLWQFAYKEIRISTNSTYDSQTYEINCLNQQSILRWMELTDHDPMPWANHLSRGKVQIIGKMFSVSREKMLSNDERDF